MNTVTQLLIAIAPYAVPVIFGLVWYLVQSGIQNLPAQKRDLAQRIAQTVVTSVEQNPPDISSNPAKKQVVTDRVNNQLNSFGVKVDPTLVSDLIEETVYAINQSKQAATVVSQPSPMSEVKGNI